MVAALATALPAAPARAACDQPLYIIAHRCNDPADVPNVVLAQEVNAIEADFSWGSPTEFVPDRWVVDHDGVFAWSTDIDDWLDGVILTLSLADSPLGLVILDIKDPDGPLLDLYSHVRGSLGPDINLLLSIPDFEEKEQFEAILSQINADPRAAVAVDYLSGDEQTMSAVDSYFSDTGFTKYWFGDGYNVTVETPQSVEDNVADAIDIRDSGADCDAFHGVYTWTYEKQSTITGFLLEGVNGVMMNADECHDIVGAIDIWTPLEAVNFAKTLTGTVFAAPEANPFRHATPNIACPSDQVVECTAPGGTWGGDPQLAEFYAAAGASIDNCDEVTVVDDGPLFYGVGPATEVTFTATDAGVCSPTDSCTASVTVQDTQAPQIDCPPDIAVDPESPAGTVVSFTATASDLCDGTPAVVCPESGDTFPIGSETVVTCTVTDAAGHQDVCDLQVKVYTPEEVVENMESAAAALAGSLNPGQLNSLLVHLGIVASAIEKDKHNQLCNKLEDIADQVDGWLDAGTVTPQQGQPLIDSALNLLATFACQ
ncbi:HYR domain-containing protein [Nannocystis radixulma]|uniref:HYR domain-containing protein n=1 Tax=Nannocystis radixulma TaxID=2995305 RepID=A0ABT5AWT5_9BACT|nr:HYR domain-containing protein [Nannocystis radixulma]MDC0666304.1 HYR domain-containing protein [Nannocystis radixulma]